jgi:hypothetical protein
MLSFCEGVGVLKIEGPESEVLKIEESESELLCTDSTALKAILSLFIFRAFENGVLQESTPCIKCVGFLDQLSDFSFLTASRR